LAQGVNLSATTLVFHSLYAGGSEISGADFRNVIGRAGRAYVDVEGLVILPVFTEERRKRSRQLSLWEALKNGSREMDVRSGLVRLVGDLLKQLQVRTSSEGIAAQAEYLLNQSDPFAWATDDTSAELSE